MFKQLPYSFSFKQPPYSFSFKQLRTLFLKPSLIYIFLLLAGLFNLLLLSRSSAQSYSSVTLINKPFNFPGNKNKSLLEQLAHYPVYQKASLLEQDFIYWTNYSRLYPVNFRDSALIPFLNDQPSAKGKYAQSLIKELGHLEALPFLAPAANLSTAAGEHVRDLVKQNGRISHSSSDGSSFSARMRKAGVNTCAAENISLGEESTLVALLLLYLDIGLPDMGHRKNLLNPSFRQIGVGVRQLSGNQYIMVQDFACASQ